VHFWNCIVRIGEFDWRRILVERQNDDFTRTVERLS
jgi:hypothetical protein